MIMFRVVIAAYAVIGRVSAYPTLHLYISVHLNPFAVGKIPRLNMQQSGKTNHRGRIQSD